MMRFKHLDEIIGKRITHVVVKERARQPMAQVIIVFEMVTATSSTRSKLT